MPQIKSLASRRFTADRGLCHNFFRAPTRRLGEQTVMTNFGRLALAVLISVALSRCAVKTYPRQVSAREKAASNVAYAVDNLGAVAHHYLLAAGPGYDLSRQRVQVPDYNFYLDPAFRQAAAFYQAPDRMPEVKQEKLQETSAYTVWLLSWPSLYRPVNPAFAPLYQTYTEDQTAYALYYQAKAPNHAALVVSHGWTGGDVRKGAKSNRLEAFVRLGFDAALIQQPYHGLRRPAGSRFSGEYFLSGEVSRLNEAMAQAVMDARSLAQWLRRDHAVVGARGGSLGGIVTLMAAAAEPELDFAVAWVPPNALGEIAEVTPLAPYIRKGFRQSGLDRETVQRVLGVTSPANYPPAIPKEDVLILAGMGDHFVPPDQPAAIWESWGHPPIFWFAGGHLINCQLQQSQQVEADFLRARLPAEAK